MSRLDEFASVTTGQSAPQDPMAFGKKGIPFIRAGSLETLINGAEEYSLELVSLQSAKEYRLKLFPAGSIVFAKSGMSATIGRVYQLKSDCYVVSHLAVIMPNESLLSSYLHKWFIANPPNRLIQNDAYPSIKTTEISALEINVPSLGAQKYIAEILDQAEALKQKRQQALALADEYLRANFLDLFGDPITNPKGWNTKRIGDLATVQTGSTPSRTNDSFWTNGHIPWVKTGEVFGKTIVDTDEKITDLAIENSNCKLFPKNTILLAMYGQGKTRGNVGLLGIEASTNQACAAILPSDELQTGFLFEYLKLQYANLRALGRGGNQENLNLSMVKDYELIIPPKPEQDKFDQIVKKVEALKSKMQTSETEIEHLAKSLSQKAFRGELVK